MKRLWTYPGGRQKKATDLGVSGWCRNLENGQVEALIQGNDEQIPLSTIAMLSLNGVMRAQDGLSSRGAAHFKSRDTFYLQWIKLQRMFRRNSKEQLLDDGSVWEERAL